jgi:hypothetical protein
MYGDTNEPNRRMSFVPMFGLFPLTPGLNDHVRMAPGAGMLIGSNDTVAILVVELP